MLSSVAPPPGWAGEFSCPCVVKLGPQAIVFSVQQHVLGITDFLSSPGRIFLVLGHPVLPLHGFVAKQACLLKEPLIHRGLPYFLLTMAWWDQLFNHLFYPFILSLSLPLCHAACKIRVKGLRVK